MFVVMTAVVLAFTRITGPFIVTPIVMCGCLMQWAAMRSVNKRLWFVLSWAIVAVMLPFVLEWTGVIDSTYALHGGALLTRSDVLDLVGATDEVALVVVNALFVVSAAVVAVYLGRTRLAAQRQVQIQAWHLRQLLPAQRPPSAVNVMAASWC